MRASASASSSSPSALRSLALSAAASLPVVDATELALDVLTWTVVALLLVLLFKLHRIYQRRSGYREIKQDDHVLYSQSLMGTKDSWETIPLAERKA
ncbi:hypothetical protein Gpo141_00003041 [Globisporangium polare]